MFARDDKASQLIESFQLSVDEMPAVVTSDGEVCRNPSVASLANALGLSDLGADEVYDMAIVGGGPAGLAAAVYGGSEGLKAIVLDAHAPGGQAGTSSKIENYLGFPMGISGAELAQNALVQAEKSGVRFATPRRVAQVIHEGAVYRLELNDGDQLKARTVLAASGVRLQTRRPFIRQGPRVIPTTPRSTLSLWACKQKPGGKQLVMNRSAPFIKFPLPSREMASPHFSSPRVTHFSRR